MNQRARQRARRWLVGALLGGCIGAGVVLTLPGRMLVAARASLFNRRTTLDELRAHARLPPGAWIPQEQPAALASVRAQLVRRAAIAAWLATPVAATSTDEALAIAARLSAATTAVCSPERDLVAKTLGLLDGTGAACCSDFVEVFQLLASLRGLATREVSNARHEYVEYWDAQRGRWNVLDPMFGLAAVGPAEAPASALEIALGTEPGRAPPAIAWRPIASRAPAPPRAAYYAQPEAFRTLVVTERSDVAAQAAFDRHLRFLPKPFAQLIELVSGARPRWTEVRAPR